MVGYCIYETLRLVPFPWSEISNSFLKESEYDLVQKEEEMLILEESKILA